MATSASGDVLQSEGWQQDELSEMKSLLRRAEQRMRKLDPASKNAVKTTDFYKYAAMAHHSTPRISPSA